MFYSPIVIKKYKLDTSQSSFLKELRSVTREPYFDNDNNRRQYRDGHKLFLNEFDQFLFLKNEIIGFRGIVNKTFIHLVEKNGKLKIFTLSYIGGLGGTFYFGFLLFFLPFYFIILEPEGASINFLLGYLGFYILSVINVNSDFHKQNSLILQTVEKIKERNHNKQYAP